MKARMLVGEAGRQELPKRAPSKLLASRCALMEAYHQTHHQSCVGVGALRARPLGAYRLRRIVLSRSGDLSGPWSILEAPLGCMYEDIKKHADPFVREGFCPWPCKATFGARVAKVALWGTDAAAAHARISVLSYRPWIAKTLRSRGGPQGSSAVLGQEGGGSLAPASQLLLLGYCARSPLRSLPSSPPRLNLTMLLAIFAIALWAFALDCVRAQSAANISESTREAVPASSRRLNTLYSPLQRITVNARRRLIASTRRFASWSHP